MMRSVPARVMFRIVAFVAIVSASIAALGAGVPPLTLVQFGVDRTATPWKIYMHGSNAARGFLGTLDPAGGVFSPPDVVANTATLQAFTSYGLQIRRSGAVTPGDGGTANYTHVAAVCPMSGGDGGSCIPAADGGSWRLDPSTRVTPYLFRTGAVDDTSALQAAWNYVQYLQTNGFAEAGTLDLGAAQWQISAPLSVRALATPYGLKIQNGSIVPAKSPVTGLYYAGNLVDFSAAATLTNLRFEDLTINGFNVSANCLKIGAKTQGVWIYDDIILGCTNSEIWDTTKAAGTELKVYSNVLQGGTASDMGTGIITSGNDGLILGNVIRNMMVGINLRNASWTLIGNHIYPVNPDVPRPLVIMATGSQVQSVGNYYDEGYLYIENPSQFHSTADKFLTAANYIPKILLPSGATVPFSPVVLAPTSSRYDLYSFGIISAQYISLFKAGFNPVYIDTTGSKTITSCQETRMGDDNVFVGFNAKYTQPFIRSSLTTSTNLSAQFNTVLPWCNLQYVKNYVLESQGINTVTSVAVSGTVATITTGRPYTGAYSITATVDSDGN